MPHSCEQMYALVGDIDSYSRFLPWCSESRIEERDGEQIKARIAYCWKGLHGSFVTRNTHQAKRSIVMKLCEGPFKELQGQWTFVPLGEHACKLQFVLHISFSNRLYEMTMGPVFHSLANSLMDGFLQRARALEKLQK